MPAPTIVTRDLSLVLGTSATRVFAGNALPNGLFYMRIWNVSATATVWLSRTTTLVAPNAAGSFPLGPGLNETWTVPQAIPLNDLWAAATAAGTPLTVEVG